MFLLILKLNLTKGLQTISLNLKVSRQILSNLLIMVKKSEVYEMYFIEQKSSVDYLFYLLE